MKTYTKRDIDLSYMAATLDDEGCIRVRLVEGNKLRVIVSIQMTTIEPLELFKFYFKGGLHKKKKKTKGGLPVFRYYASHRRAEYLIKELLPFLMVKKARADLALRIFNIKLSHGGKDPRARKKLELASKLNSMNSSKGGISKVVRMTMATA
jgi:hypothetical protein